jgi:RHS repeat-associated protein
MKRFTLTLFLSLFSAISFASDLFVETETFYATNYKGDVIAAMDESGNEKWRVDYDPWGKPTVTGEHKEDATPRYGGHEYYPELGMYYMKGRWYHPELRTFTSMDPAGYRPNEPLSAHPMLYANNSPYMYIDPDGNRPQGTWTVHNGSAVYNYWDADGAAGDIEAQVQGAYSQVGQGVSEGWMYSPPLMVGTGLGAVGLATKGLAAKGVIGFSDDAARSALSNVGRVDHASRHLIGAGIIAGNPGSKAARQAFQDLAQGILTNPTKTFDHVMSKGGQRVKGFLGQSNGQNVIIFVAKEARGKVGAGDVVTAIKPSAQQLSNFGL